MKPSQGEITVLGEPIWRNPALYFRIGFAWQTHLRTDDRFEWVSALVRLNGVGEREAGEMHRALEMVDFLDAAGKKIGAYSKGCASAQLAGAGARSRVADPG